MKDFEWDKNKAASNLRKHGVSFDDAVCVFSDYAMQTLDSQTTNGEVRYVSIGMSCIYQLLIVVWTHRDSKIRIISARKASKQERNFY